MTYTGTYGSLSELTGRVITTSWLIALAMVVTFTSLATQPAQAQTGDTWKSVAIIGGATAAGAYVGHKIAGPTGAYIGAGVGATAGYAIDRRRRQNEYYNQGNADSGYYDPNGGYYPNGSYNGGPYDNGAYSGGMPYQGSNNYSRSTNRRSCSRARR
jgi:hypothetical protein